MLLPLVRQNFVRATLPSSTRLAGLSLAPRCVPNAQIRFMSWTKPKAPPAGATTQDSLDDILTGQSHAGRPTLDALMDSQTSTPELPYDGPPLPPDGAYPRGENAVKHDPISRGLANFRPRVSSHRTYSLHVQAAKHNTVITLAWMTPGPHYGDVVAWASSGSAGYKKAQRGSYEAGYQVAVQMFKKLELEKFGKLHPPSGKKDDLGRRPISPDSGLSIDILFNGFGLGREAVFRALLTSEGDVVRPLVKRLIDSTPIKVGGTRSRKMQRK